MDDVLYEKVRAYLAQHEGVNEVKLRPETRLIEDIGMDGTDAEEFMENFGREFDIDMSKFDFDIYFFPENENIFRTIYMNLFDRDKLSRTVVTLQNLTDIAEQKKWKHFSGNVSTITIMDSFFATLFGVFVLIFLLITSIVLLYKYGSMLMCFVTNWLCR